MNKIIFICHDQLLVEKLYNEYENPYVLFVGNKNIDSSLFPNLIIVRDLPYNIEHENLLLTFTAWYSIIKNNLFIDTEYLCLLEYDVNLSYDFSNKLLYTINQNHPDVVYFMSSELYFWYDINRELLKSFVNNKNINHDYNNTFWMQSTNLCIKRDIIKEFVDWYYPNCLEIKKKDPKKLGYYHERLFNIFCRSKNFNLIHMDGLTHQELCSHNTPKHEINTYILIYYDETNKYTDNINRLINSIFKFNRNHFQFIIFKKSLLIEKPFFNKYKHIFEKERGGGYWLWKPFIINYVLENDKSIKDNDTLIYIDSSYYFLEPFEDLYLEKIKESDIIVWKNKPNESINLMKNYCKPDVVYKYKMKHIVYTENYTECWAGLIVLKNNEYSKKIMKEWLDMCCIEEDLTDTKSEIKNKYFIDHRHDQCLLSICLYKNNIKTYEMENKILQNIRNPFYI